MSSLHLDDALLLFFALFALYSPIAALASYLPYMEGYSRSDQRKLAWQLFVNTTILMLAALWVGEPLLELLGLSTAALSATGGIALLLAAVPMMTGQTATAVEPVSDSPAAKDRPAVPPWRSIAFTPLTFPLTFGGTTFGFFVAYRAEAPSTTAAVGLTIAGLAYAALTGITLALAGRLTHRITASTTALLEKVAGILLTAIAVTLIASGGTRLIVDVIDSL
ncbi:MarC family protein [Streptomyces sp. NPDC055749]